MPRSRLGFCEAHCLANGLVMKRVLFLFNHDAAHQAAHIAGIMASLAARGDGCEVHAAIASTRIEAELRRLISEADAGRIHWHMLTLEPLTDAMLALPNKLLPARRLARLRVGQPLFAQMNAIVSTERTCLRARRRLRRTMGDAAPLFVYVPHGSGDRNVAYHPELAQFDHMLLSGQKLIDEMIARGLSDASHCHLIGYPKFDTINREQRQKLFANDLPTFVYNPHFDPVLSSWYDHGPQLLRWFANQGDRFNLVFAPHVMLFRKKLHISLEYRAARFRPEIPAEAISAPNILVDVDGPRLFDMTYTLAADGYVGDMSSQVYEFLIKRRPVFFIDTHSSRLPHETANRAFWASGPVVRGVGELAALLPRYAQIGEEYRAAQDRLFAYTIDDRPDEKSVERAAAALARIAGSNG